MDWEGGGSFRIVCGVGNGVVIRIIFLPVVRGCVQLLADINPQNDPVDITTPCRHAAAVTVIISVSSSSDDDRFCRCQLSKRAVWNTTVTRKHPRTIFLFLNLAGNYNFVQRPEICIRKMHYDIKVHILVSSVKSKFALATFTLRYVMVLVTKCDTIWMWQNVIQSGVSHFGATFCRYMWCNSIRKCY